jgi:hypothetical protein
MFILDIRVFRRVFQVFISGFVYILGQGRAVMACPLQKMNEKRVYTSLNEH